MLKNHCAFASVMVIPCKAALSVGHAASFHVSSFAGWIHSGFAFFNLPVTQQPFSSIPK
jgi:hypothetical protein